MDFDDLLADLSRETPLPTHWLDQSHMLVLRTGCKREIYSYNRGTSKALTVAGTVLQIAQGGHPITCPECLTARNKACNF